MKQIDHPFEVTVVEEDKDAYMQGVRAGWTLVGVDEYVAVQDPEECEDVMKDGRACVAYFDTNFHNDRIDDEEARIEIGDEEDKAIDLYENEGGAANENP